MRLHAHVPHEMNVELGRGDESLGAHGALPLPFLAVAWSMAAAVPLTGEVAVNMAAQMGLEVRVGSTLLSTVADVHIRMFRYAKLSCIVPTVIEEKLVFRWDVPRGAEVNLSIVRISYEILLFPVPGFAYKHHPVTFIFISCNDAELQDAVVVDLPDVTSCFVCPVGHLQRMALLPD